MDRDLGLNPILVVDDSPEAAMLIHSALDGVGHSHSHSSAIFPDSAAILALVG